MYKLTRRETLVGLVALGAGASVTGLGPRPAVAAAAGRLDVHHHYMSPEWKMALLERTLRARFDT